MEQEKFLNNLVSSNDLSKDGEYLFIHLRGLDDKSTAKKFNLLNPQAQQELRSLTSKIYSIDTVLAIPLVRQAIQSNISADKLFTFNQFVSKLSEFPNFVNTCVDELSSQNRLFDLFHELSNIGDGSLEILEDFENGSIEFSVLEEAIQALRRGGFSSTKYLAKDLMSSDDRVDLIYKYSGILASFENGKFDADNELHRNLEYTRFKSIIDHKKLKST